MTRAMRTMTIGALALAAPGALVAETYDVDVAHSKVLFKVRHLGISTVTGAFNDFSGTFTFDGTDFANAGLEASVKTASVDTDNQKRDDHLRSADFFETETHPEMRFVGKKVTDVTEAGFKLTGDLTIRGVTKSVTFDVEFLGQVKDPWGNHRAGFTATSTIDRQDYGLKWNQAIEAGGLLVSNDVEIVLEIQGIARKG